MVKYNYTHANQSISPHRSLVVAYEIDKFIIVDFFPIEALSLNFDFPCTQ